MMATLDEKIAAVFGKKKPAEAAPKPPAAAPAPAKKTPTRGIADITVAMEAQRIYSPDRPPAPASKGPSKDMMGQGTAPALDQSGAWGKPA